MTKIFNPKTGRMIGTEGSTYELLREYGWTLSAGKDSLIPPAKERHLYEKIGLQYFLRKGVKVRKSPVTKLAGNPIAKPAAKLAGKPAPNQLVVSHNSRLISQVWKDDRKHLTWLFMLLKYYGIPPPQIKNILYRNRNKTDVEVINAFLAVPSLKISSGLDNDIRGTKRGEDLKKLIALVSGRYKINFGSSDQYLDVGAGDGVITKAVSTALGIPLKNTYAVDNKDWIGEEIKAAPSVGDINYDYLEDHEGVHALPYEDGKFSLITIFQALHHFEDLENMLTEIRRVSAECCVIIIREHDAVNDTVKRLIEIEHLLYSVVADGIKIDDHIEKYFGRYKSADMWRAIFDHMGFHQLVDKKMDNPAKHYYAVFIKKDCSN